MFFLFRFGFIPKVYCQQQFICEDLQCVVTTQKNLSYKITAYIEIRRDAKQARIMIDRNPQQVSHITRECILKTDDA